MVDQTFLPQIYEILDQIKVIVWQKITIRPFKEEEKESD